MVKMGRNKKTKEEIQRFIPERRESGKRVKEEKHEQKKEWSQGED